jgi:hypothetical protein
LREKRVISGKRAAPRVATPAPEPQSLLRILLATITGTVYLLVGTLFFSVVSILVAPIPPRGNWTNRAARMWAKGLLWSSWIRRDVPSPPAGPGRSGVPGISDRFVIMANLEPVDIGRRRRSGQAGPS